LGKLVSLWGFYVRRPCSGIADKYFFFLLGLCQLFISRVGVGVGGLSKPTDTEDTSKEWKSCTTVRRPYNRIKLATLTEFRDGSMSLSESFDPDDPNLIDRFPDHPPETDIVRFINCEKEINVY
jgi:hypothetical protein